MNGDVCKKNQITRSSSGQHLASIEIRISHDRVYGTQFLISCIWQCKSNNIFAEIASKKKSGDRKCRLKIVNILSIP